jgi:hypothetical protein
MSNVGDQYVAYLRPKIDRAFGCTDQQNVPETGYGPVPSK